MGSLGPNGFWAEWNEKESDATVLQQALGTWRGINWMRHMYFLPLLLLRLSGLPHSNKTVLRAFTVVSRPSRRQTNWKTYKITHKRIKDTRSGSLILKAQCPTLSYVVKACIRTQCSHPMDQRWKTKQETREKESETEKSKSKTNKHPNTHTHLHGDWISLKIFLLSHHTFQVSGLFCFHFGHENCTNEPPHTWFSFRDCFRHEKNSVCKKAK